MKRILITTALGLTLAMPAVAQDIGGSTMPESTIQTEVQGEGALESGAMTPGNGAPVVQLETDAATDTAWQSLTADELHGKPVLGPDGETVGDVSDVVFDDRMQVSEVIVDVGGFLGIGEKSVAIAPEQIELMQNGDDMTLHIAATEDELKAMPEYQG